MKTKLLLTQRANDLIAWWNSLTEEQQQTAWQDRELQSMVKSAHLWLKMEETK